MKKETYTTPGIEQIVVEPVDALAISSDNEIRGDNDFF